jgi:hypothetical protein
VVSKLFVKSLKSKLLVSSLLSGLLLFSSFSSSFKSFFNSEPSVPFLPTEKEMNQRAESFLASSSIESLIQKAKEKQELSLRNNNLNQDKNDFSIQSNKSYGPDVVDEDGNWQFGLTFHLPTERMVLSSWSNFWLVDTVPLIIRKGILSMLGNGDSGNTSQKTRDFIMGKTSEFAKGNYGDKKQLHAVYWDRAIPWPIFLLLQAALGDLVLNQISKLFKEYKVWRNSASARIPSRQPTPIPSRQPTPIPSRQPTPIPSRQPTPISNPPSPWKEVPLPLNPSSSINASNVAVVENLSEEEEINTNSFGRELYKHGRRLYHNSMNIKILSYLETAFNWLIHNIEKFLAASIIAVSYAIRWIGNKQLADDMRDHPDTYKESVLSWISGLWENIKNIPFIGEALGLLIDNDLFTYTGVPLY